MSEHQIPALPFPATSPPKARRKRLGSTLANSFLAVALLACLFGTASDGARAETVAAGRATGPSAGTGNTRKPQAGAPGGRKLPAPRPRSTPQKKTEASGPLYGTRDDVMAFAAALAQAQQLDSEWVQIQLGQARFQPSVARLIMPPPAGVAKNWQAYRSRFIEPQRIRAGLAWWRQHEEWLARAESRWGVPASMVVAIVGVETFYGRMTGSFKVIDALSTLSFDFPSGRSDRSAFFRSELGAFLTWCAAEQRDPQQIRGSFAGAMGLPQFMPSSILQYAVDFDEDGRIQLDNSGADVIGSVAHYFAQHGWVSGMPTHFPVIPPDDTEHRARLLQPDIVPSFSVSQFNDAGAVLAPQAARFDGKLALVELQNGNQAPSHVAGTANFRVVTRYNWSSYYALAVIELAQTLESEHTAKAAAASASNSAATP